jgi:hypothetical protein
MEKVKLKVLKENAENAYKAADPNGKKLLEELFPDVFSIDPYLKACEALGKTPVPPLADRSDADNVSADAYARLIICIRAKNLVDGKIWVPVYDGSEYHYWPYFKKDESGFGFSFTVYDLWCTVTDVGSRLEYRTRELAEEGAVEFKQYYNDFFSPIQS